MAHVLGFHAAGADVISLIAYRTLTTTWTDQDFQRLENYPPDIILFSSGSAITGLVRILGEERARLLTARMVTLSIGPSTSAVARSHGISITAEAAVPSLNGLVRALMTFSNRPTG